MEKVTQSIIYCTERDTLCLGIDYLGDGTCKHKSCILDDPGYKKRQEAIQQRREELQSKRRSIREEERAAAKNIRRQTKTTKDLLQEEIDRKQKRMESYYTKGWTRLAEKESRELGMLEKRLRRMKKT